MFLVDQVSWKFFYAKAQNCSVVSHKMNKKCIKFNQFYYISIMILLKAFALLFATTLVSICEGNTAAQCAQFGINDKHYWTYGNNNQDEKEGYYTIAAKEFDAKYIAAIGSRYSIAVPIDGSIKPHPSRPNGRCPWVWPDAYGGTDGEGKIKPCVPNNEVRMDMYLVKQGGRVLHGWVHVEVELLDQNDEIEIIYIQMRDEAFNAIGEFVTAANHPGATCKPSKDYLATPKHFEFFPCSATGLRESKTSEAIMMAKEEYYFKKKILTDKKYLHEGSIARGVHFLWKFDEYWCSRHQRIQPFAYILTKNNRQRNDRNDNPRMPRKVPNYWLHPKWFGASDIIFKNGGALDCSELAIDDNTGVVTSGAVNSWFQADAQVLILKEDNWHPKNRYQLINAQGKPGNYGSKLCQADPLDFHQTKDTVPVFSGRCKHHFAKEVSRNEFQGCNTNPNSEEFKGVDTSKFPVYHDYLEEKQRQRIEFCSVNCTAPKTKEDLERMMAFPAKNDTEEFREIYRSRAGQQTQVANAKRVKLWAGRRYHGVTYGFGALFITPASVFIARNYKETFMRKRCYGVHLWYWSHFGSIIATMCLGFSGHAAISPFLRIWGHSTNDSAKLHKIFGYSSVCCFAFLVVFGGFRCRRPGVLRKLTITLHALVGFAHNWLNLVAVMYSTWIPQSPSLHDCDKVTGVPEGFSLIFWITVVWTFIDFVFHVILTVLHITRDRAIGLWRSWYFPIVPLVRQQQMVDMQGEALRKLLLFLYLVIGLAVAFVACILMITKKMPVYCKAGNTTCKHYFGCTELAIKYETSYVNQGGVLDWDD